MSRRGWSGTTSPETLATQGGGRLTQSNCGQRDEEKVERGEEGPPPLPDEEQRGTEAYPPDTDEQGQPDRDGAALLLVFLPRGQLFLISESFLEISLFFL